MFEFIAQMRKRSLLRQLDRGSISARTKAARALGRLRDPEAVNTLIKCLRNDEAPFHDLREAAALALGEIGDERAIYPLINHLLGDYGVEFSRPFPPAFDALARIGGSAVVDELVKRLTGIYRVEAAQTLAKLGEVKWLEYVRGDLQDYVRLGETGDTRLINCFMRTWCTSYAYWCDTKEHFCSDSEFYIRRKEEYRKEAVAIISGLDAIAKSEPQSITLALSQQLWDASSLFKTAGKTALKTLFIHIDSKTIMRAISNELQVKGTKGGIVSHYAEALGAIADIEAIPVLNDCINYVSHHNRQAAAHALGQIGDVAGLAVLHQRLEKEQEKEVRESILIAIKEIQSQTP